MAGSSFNGVSQVASTRASISKRLGEIIEDIIGDARVRDLLDRAGKHPDEYAGKPTGVIALDLKVITPDTKNALLVAQAAERAYVLAEKAEAIAAKNPELIRRGETIGTAGIVQYDDPVFKYVGSEKDPEIVKRAQATWMAAQMLVNNEIWAVNGRVENVGYVANPSSMGIKAAQGFKAAAAELYAEAGKMMGQEGHADAAAKFAGVAQALAATAGGGPSPDEVMRSMERDFAGGSRDLAIILNDDRYLDGQPMQDVLLRLARLTEKPGQAGVPTAAPKPAV